MSVNINQAHLDYFASKNVVMAKFVKPNYIPVVLGDLIGNSEIVSFTPINNYEIISVKYNVRFDTKQNSLLVLDGIAKGGMTNFDNTFYIETRAKDVVPEPEPEPEPTPLMTITQKHLDDFANANAKLFFNDVAVNVGSKFFTGDVAKATANSGYSFISVFYRDDYGGVNYFNVGNDEKTATSNLNNFDSGFTVNSIADDIPVTPEPSNDYIYVYTQAQINFLQSENVTAHVKYRDDDGYFVDEPVINGTGIKTGYEIYFVAGDDFEFELITPDKANIGYRDDYGSYIYFPYNFENPSIANVVVGSDFSDVSFVGLVGNSSEIDTKGVNDVFLITDETMREIINANFNFNNGQETIDYGKYILGLLELPFSIDAEFIKFTDVEIGLAGYKTGFSGDLLKSDVLNVNMGVIEVIENKNNFLDYVNTVAVLHLPFSDPVNIDINYVIGYEIGIEYLINLYDGLATINISSSKIGGVITTLSIDLNVSIPFGSVSSQPPKNDPSNVKLGGYNGVTSPYVEILRNDAVLENGFFTIPVVDETLLIEQNGFVKIDEIDLKVKASKDEKEMILNAINQGVIIK